MADPKFTLFNGNDRQFYFNLKSGNGENILQSEAYRSKSGSQNGIASIRKNAAIDDRFERRASIDGKFYYVLKSANGEIISTSETYDSTQAMENGISAVKKDAPYAILEDLT